MYPAKQADTLIRAATAAVAGIPNDGDRMAREIGILQAEVRKLCYALADARAVNAWHPSDEPDDASDYGPPVADDGYADRASANHVAWVFS